MRPPLRFTAPSRSPPRPSPGSLHYSDEDVTKYNDLIQAESSSLTEKPSEVSDSQVRGERTRCPGRGVERPLPRVLAAWWPIQVAQLMDFLPRLLYGP